MLLSDDEVRKFSDWLRQDIVSNEAILKQLDTMPALAALAKKKRVEVMAEKVVLKILTETEPG